MSPLSLLIFYLVLLPILSLSIEFHRIVHGKMRLQMALDQAAFQGGQVLTQRLNEIVGLNKNANEMFKETAKEFQVSSKDSPKTAAGKIEALQREQNLLLKQMQKKSEEAYAQACQTVRASLSQHDPEIEVVSWNGNDDGSCPAEAMIRLENAQPVDLRYAFIESQVLEPTGYSGGPSNRYLARPAFVKMTAPVVQLAVAAVRKIPLPFLRYFSNQPENSPAMTVHALSVVQPFGGNVARFEPYRTALIPQEGWGVWQ